ncbi:IS30 family transposase [[Mycobacterium] wendilense]|uniref:IS30 family transposase n=1 Tax=[Mycobacterium] wendilense TaxID=3064284 RepID=A0ABN9P9A9_9MYCO|nr:IS30 family transposase [Mycolicibacterium sp. MU0050]CAJ1585365.1 IS30 family transposase [Mycolicibacterium sp. MU0050]
MSFSEDCVQFGDQLAKLVDAGVPVREAAESLGVSRQRAYAILSATGRPMGSPRPDVTGVDPARVAAVFAATGSVNAAAKAVGVAHSTARRMLVEAGLVDPARRTRGKTCEKARFFELLEEGWSSARAAREAGVNVRTARDWRAGIRKVGNTRVYSDGTVVDYASGTRYIQPVKSTAAEQRPASGQASASRYLQLADRLVIADGLTAGLSYTVIADKLGRNKSTVSREVAAHRVEGLYLPYQADAAAAAARSRPKQSKLVTNQRLRKEVEEGLAKRWSPEEISHRLVKDFPDDESMRVSHETIYQSLYFQARGGLKKEVAQSLRSGRTCRKPNRKPGERYQRFVDPMLMIADRPDIEDRAVPGHWEGDLIMGELNKTAIGTLVERTTRYTMLVHLPGGHDAETVRDGLIATMTTLPEHLRGSLTWDQVLTVSLDGYHGVAIRH